uniref:uncharacterized protein LOC120346542 n=1 Tax=Styela clava TaxID=7725 RepID=UPI00193A88AF|nr:uncharacterized protein LOC120346542 [Styela clava]
MPRKWKRTSKRCQWMEENMKKAIEMVQSGGKLLTAARTYSVPRATLRRHVYQTLKKAPGSRSLGCSPTLGQNEKDLLQHILEFEKRGFPLTVKDIRKLAYEFAMENKIPNKFSESSKMAGKDWWSGFRERYGNLITIRKPQPLSIQRAIHLNKPTVNKYFDLLEAVMKENSLFNSPARIYNMDETGLSLVPGVSVQKELDIQAK